MTITRFLSILLATAGIATACTPGSTRQLTDGDRRIIADSIRKIVVATYDLQRPGAVDRMMALYPTSDPVYSTSSGQVSTTRAELQRQIETFWKYVGSNMRDPRWEWTSMHIDVVAPDAAVVTASYRVPHLTPRNNPHVIAGAWTAVFVNRGGRWVVIQEHLSDVPAELSAPAPRDSSQHSGH